MKGFKRTMILTGALLLLTASLLFAAISETEAQNIALTDAGVQSSDVTRIRVKRDIDDGMMVYDVEFYVGFDEYDYEIGYEDGAIYSKDLDIEREFPSAGGAVDRDGAAELALVEAGFLRSDVNRLQVESDRDDGRTIHEVTFRNGDYEYDYDIDASTGELISGEWEYNRRVSRNRNGNLLSESQALEIAQPYIPYNADGDVRIHRDLDDGVQRYELSAYIDNVQYELELDAVTGMVLQFKFERF